MARGIILGKVTDSSGSGKAQMQVTLLNLNGGDVQGTAIYFTMPQITVQAGSWPYTQSYTLTNTRLTDSDGYFALPFSWGESYVDQSLVSAWTASTISVKIIVQTPVGDGSFAHTVAYGKGCCVLDIPQMLDNIKNAVDIGAADQDVLKNLFGELKKAVKGDEFTSVHRAMMSSEQHAIVGVILPVPVVSA